MGTQPLESSSLSWLTFLSQSSDWFWLPPTTRRATGGSPTEFEFAMLPLTPIRTTMLCVQLACAALQRSTELAHCSPSSQTCATLIGPERASVAANARWTDVNSPVHLLPLPVLQDSDLPPIVS